jgi:hypothetical protein
MTQHLIKTDQQITAFVLQTMETFSSLSPLERRELRDAHRRRFVDESLVARRPFFLGEPYHQREAMYDNLDFQRG